MYIAWEQLIVWTGVLVLVVRETFQKDKNCFGWVGVGRIFWDFLMHIVMRFMQLVLKQLIASSSVGGGNLLSMSLAALL